MKIFEFKFLIKIFLLTTLFFPFLGNSLSSFAKDEDLNLENYIYRKKTDNFYILGPKDIINLKVTENFDYLNGDFIISTEGFVYLKRLEKIYVTGLTVEELSSILKKEYSKYVKNPKISIEVVSYRPVKIFVGGEVQIPGSYILTRPISSDMKDLNNSILNIVSSNRTESGSIQKNISTNNYIPTLFDAIRKSGGITPEADLENVIVTRNNSLSEGGGKIQTNINLIKGIENSDNTRNIRLFDGDSIYLQKSEDPILSQIIRGLNTNLNPEIKNVFISGDVFKGGMFALPQKTSLVDALFIAGHKRSIKGKIVFIRNLSNGKKDKRLISFNKNAKVGSYENPILMSGDIIHAKESKITSFGGAISDIMSPLRGIIDAATLYKIFND